MACISCQSKSGMTSHAMKDGRWQQFEECIKDRPTDTVCDSCWHIYIKPNHKQQTKQPIKPM